MMGSMILPKNTTTNELYAVLPLEARQELEKHEQLITVPAGTNLIEHGMISRGLTILNLGSVKISIPCSRRSASLTTGQSGKVFGMRSVISGEPAEVDVSTLEPCSITLLPREAFLNLLKARPETYFAVAKVLSTDLQMADHMLRSAVRRHSPARAGMTEC
jgi:CRP-like cAMP-binding protein